MCVCISSGLAIWISYFFFVLFSIPCKKKFRQNNFVLNILLMYIEHHLKRQAVIYTHTHTCVYVVYLCHIIIINTRFVRSFVVWISKVCQIVDNQPSQHIYYIFEVYNALVLVIIIYINKTNHHIICISGFFFYFASLIVEKTVCCYIDAHDRCQVCTCHTHIHTFESFTIFDSFTWKRKFHYNWAIYHNNLAYWKTALNFNQIWICKTFDNHMFVSFLIISNDYLQTLTYTHTHTNQSIIIDRNYHQSIDKVDNKMNSMIKHIIITFVFQSSHHTRIGSMIHCQPNE